MNKWFAIAIGASIPVAIVSCSAGPNESAFNGSGGGDDSTATSGGGQLGTTTTGSGSLSIATGAGVGTGTASGGTGGAGTGAGGSGHGGASTTSTTSTVVTSTVATSSVATSTGTGGPCASGPNTDIDMDGFTPAQGDCNDCDPAVNPGAIDVGTTDNDCDGAVNVGVTCDTGIALDDVNAIDGAKAIELCQQQTGAKWGVTSAKYVRANGTTVAPGAQVGIQPNFGPNLAVQMGKNMLAISSGRARIPNQASACTTESCKGFGSGTAPTGFPATVKNCVPDTDINDDVGLEVAIKSPTNATGYSFSFDFDLFEFPEYVCDAFNDQFIALVSPAPVGASNGNISFDSMNNPVSVNIAFFDVCDPTQIGHFAENCISFNCPAPPSPYCPAGDSQLQGNGFGSLSEYGAGATGWLKTTAPIKGGSPVTIRFAIWDTGDQKYDSTALIDNFQWIATAGAPVVVQTGHM